MDRKKDPAKPVFLVMGLSVGGDPLNPIEALSWDSTKVSLSTGHIFGVNPMSP